MPRRDDMNPMELAGHIMSCRNPHSANVGKEIGLTRERVRQIQLEALNCLRVILAREGVASELLSDLG